MEDIRKEVKEANERFYHPGWPIIFGWEKIRESWRTIFSSGGLADIEISKVYIDVDGNSAWLNCNERISYLIEDQVIITMAQTTNIFELDDQKWRMVLHHASPMPIPQSEVSTETIQ